MANIEIEVDINIEDYLDEVSASDLIDALSYKKLSSGEKTEISAMINGVKTGQINLNNLITDIKMDAVLEGIESKSLTEIQNFFKL